MQTSNARGKRTRFVLMPISWAIAGVTVYHLMVILSKISGSSIKALFQTDLLWSLMVILPGFFFGKVLGLIIVHVIAFIIPPLRHAFEEEVSETGRHSFLKTMWDLIKLLALTGMVTLIGCYLFLQFK